MPKKRSGMPTTRVETPDRERLHMAHIRIRNELDRILREVVPGSIVDTCAKAARRAVIMASHCAGQPILDSRGTELRTLRPWEDPTCGGCQLAADLRADGSKGAGCADHEEPETPDHINPVCKLPLNVCRRATAHTHCPECGSTAHTAADCDMEG